MNTKSRNKLIHGIIAIAMAVGVMADSHGQTRLPVAPPNLIGPISVPAAVPTFSALGNCQQLTVIHPGETIVINCNYQPPIATDTSDVVVASVATGNASIEGWIVSARAAGASDLSNVLTVAVAVRNDSAAIVRTPVMVAATIFYVPKSTTPAVVAAGVE